MVIGEAMACGCTVIATTNTGARDDYKWCRRVHSTNSFTSNYLRAFERLADQPNAKPNWQCCFITCQTAWGWDHYGEQWSSILTSIPC